MNDLAADEKAQVSANVVSDELDEFEWSGLSHYPTLRLRYGESMSISEIASQLGVSERTVNRRLADERARYLAARLPELRQFRVMRE